MPSYVAISSEQHAKKYWRAHSSFAFAKNENVAPIFINELVDAVHTLPIAFAKHENEFFLVVLMGLRQNENLLVDDNGKWLAGGFTPANYRSRPFALVDAPNNKDGQMLCIEESSLTDRDTDAPIFDNNADITETVRSILTQLTHYESTRLLTKTICTILAENKLLTPWEFLVNDGESEKPFKGLYRVDEAALNTLPPETFLSLREAAAFPVIYAQLLSMNNITALSKLLNYKIQSSFIAPKEEERNETFNFSGL